MNFQFYYDDPVIAAGDFVDYTTKANLAAIQVQRIFFGECMQG
jgi:hypothetical protein